MADGTLHPMAGTRDRWLDPRVRIGVSVVIALHFLAIISAPLAMTPTSPFLIAIWSGFRPYLDVMYLNHGFHFFAPDPGPSHLVRYELAFADGTRREGLFPDPAEHSPRLLYHRHFMLSEFANRLAVDDSRKADLEALSRSFGEHLLATHQAARVQLFLRRHFIPTTEHVLSGLALDDPQFLHERPLGEFAAATASSSSPTSEPVLESPSYSPTEPLDSLAFLPEDSP